MDQDTEICERIPTSAKPSTEHSYASVEEELVGFDNHVEIIIEKLTRGTRELDAVWIVGMTGIGKTALARNIYSSLSIASHFDVQAWCSVSQIYNVRKLALEILKQIAGDKCVDVDYPAVLLRKCLLEKRYLIVLDDIWELDAWDDMRFCFPHMENGSRIMGTTRNGDLGKYVTRQDVQPYLLEFLTDEKSWELLQKKVFQGENCPLELRNVGPLVAKRCKGLPSLIITIAGILSRRREASFWLKVAYDISSYASEEDMKKIQSSYDSLPDHLKPCLLYMGLFPKDYAIPVSDLLKWWIAEDFVQNFDTLQLEGASQCYLDELVGRNLVVVSKRRANGEMKCCIVVDQVREFCLRKVTEEKFMQRIVPPQSVDSNEERLCMYIYDTMPSDFKERKSHGSLEFISHPKLSISNSKKLFPLLDNFRLVQVLHLLDIYLDNSWAAAFRSLTQLRYLAIFVKAFELKWVSHLLHLQTLRVRSSYIMISPAIWKMKNLRHVDINEFPITWKDDERVNFHESTDIVLDNLKTLGMCYMSVADMTPKFWEKFPNLEELRLQIDEFVNVPSYSVSRLMSLEMFPSHLRDLSLSEIFLTDEIVSSIAKLKHLKALKLSEIYFTGEKIWNLNDNEFEELKVLKLHHVFMSEWIFSYDTFRVLKYLAIKSCPMLEEIPLDFAYIDSLRTIKVIDCSYSVGESAMKIKKERKECYGEDILQLLM